MSQKRYLAGIVLNSILPDLYAKSYLSKMPQITVSPQHSMYDSPVSINVFGLKELQKVTLTTNVHYGKNEFESKAMFVADKNGEINCNEQSSIDGTYKGIDGMGLVWSLRAVIGQKQQRLLPRDVTQPIRFNIRLWDGHVTHYNGRLLDENYFERHLLHWNVTRTEVKHGRLRGMLFRPRECSQPLPGVIDLFGSAGGLVEHRGALLANNGFVVLSLAYFAYDDLPSSMDTPIELNYFEEAADWLSSQPNVISDRIGIIGVSLGADIAIMAGIHFDKIKAVIGINGFHMIDPANPMTLNAKSLPQTSFKIENIRFDSEGRITYGKHRLEMPCRDELVFQMEKSTDDSRFLLVASGDDLDSPSGWSAKILKERMERNGKGERCCVFELEGAGHLLEPPYTPHCYASFHKSIGVNLVWGGEKYKHKEAQEKSWKFMKEFLRENIGEPAKVPPFDRSHRSRL